MQKGKSMQIHFRCDHCGLVPPPNPRNENIWNGFRDADTGEKVCWDCRHDHYSKKYRGPHAGKISESPIPIIHEAPTKVKFQFDEKASTTNSDTETNG